MRINRIRLEFKAKHGLFSKVLLPGINRIRLEFKGIPVYTCSFTPSVLIESDWNLKEESYRYWVKTFNVLIESDWNLKIITIMSGLKVSSINRIRLEFKVWSFEGFNIAIYVLIESDWNLKYRSTLLCYLLT